MSNAKHLGVTGTFLLQEAVMQFLFDKYVTGHGFGPAEISKTTGIYRKSPQNDFIVTKILHSLEDRVIKKPQANGKPGWQLSPAEYKHRTNSHP